MCALARSPLKDDRPMVRAPSPTPFHLSLSLRISGFGTLMLAYMLDSLVRVSRRVVRNPLTSDLKPRGEPPSPSKRRGGTLPKQRSRRGARGNGPATLALARAGLDPRSGGDAATDGFDRAGVSPVHPTPTDGTSAPPHARADGRTSGIPAPFGAGDQMNARKGTVRFPFSNFKNF